MSAEDFEEMLKKQGFVADSIKDLIKPLATDSSNKTVSLGKLMNFEKESEGM